MSLARLRRLGFAAWLVAIALIANAAAQNQLALNVVDAATEQAAPAAIPAQTTAGPHAHHDHAAHMAAMQAAAAQVEHAAHQHHAGSGGHTHKGHADCSVCGAVAVMAALTLPATLVLDIPRDVVRSAEMAVASVIRTAARYERYNSRAPPTFS